VGVLATAVVAQDPAAPAAVPIGVPTAAETSKGPAAPVVGPAGELALAARKRRLARGWPVMVLTTVPAGVPTIVVVATEPVVGPVGHSCQLQ
jgi:hypothetical protein